MLTVLALAALYGGYRVVRAVLAPLQALPQRNEDMIFY